MLGMELAKLKTTTKETLLANLTEAYDEDYNELVLVRDRIRDAEQERDDIVGRLGEYRKLMLALNDGDDEEVPPVLPEAEEQPDVPESTNGDVSGKNGQVVMTLNDRIFHHLEQLDDPIPAVDLTNLLLETGWVTTSERPRTIVDSALSRLKKDGQVYRSENGWYV